jgi:2-(1,2-epoxy-1,2-dihydrophenyl)acetyl-CoA isomerase
MSAVAAPSARSTAFLPAEVAGPAADVRVLSTGTTVSAARVDGEGWIVLHGSKVHVLTESFPGELAQAVAAVSDAAEVRCVVLTGTTAVFCAGADIGLAGRLRGPAFGRWWLDAHHAALAQLAELPKPVVCAVNGAAAGAGFNLALACDVLVASATATFAQAFVRIGLATDMGSLHLLPRRVGFHRARELMYSGRALTAAEALEIGAIDELCDGGDLLGRARTRAAELGAGPPRAFAAIKAGMAHAPGTLRASLELEAQLQADILQTQDFAEGAAAFLAKRPPAFTGR